MACQKRIYRKRKGLADAALQLGATYSHLRRVLTGERQGKALLAAYKKLKKKREQSDARV